MMTLMIAAIVAAQPAPPADMRGQMAPMHQDAKEDCCKDGCKCCNDMDAKHADHAGEHGSHSAH
jgi:hypothetical protein